MSKELHADKFLTVSDFNVKPTNSKEVKLSSSLSNLRQDAIKQKEYVNHPNCVPESQPKSVIGPSESHDTTTNSLIGQVQPCDTRPRSCDSNSAVKGKPPSGTAGSLSDSNVARNRAFLYRSTSETHENKSKGSVASLGSPGNEEEVIISYQDEAVDIADTGAGNQELGIEDTALRLLIISSKLRNTTAVRHALQPNVVFVQYKYDTCTLEGILSSIEQSLGERKCESIALILSCSGLSIQLCGKEEKLQVLTKENVSENQSVRDFFSTLVTQYLDKTSPGARLDFLSCNLMLHTDGGGLDKELEAFVGVPVKLHKDLTGCEVQIQKTLDDASKNVSIGELYFKLDKLRGWSGQQQQTLAGFEKIQTVGKGAYGAAVLYRKKDDDSLVILKEINMHDLNASERQLALNEVNILAMLEHPNIISYFDSFEEDGVIMIEMEYADGGTLAKFLSSQDKPLDEKDIVAMFQQILAAITHIHKHNILHRDLKTANIFLTKEGVVKVGDFGISKMMSTVNKGANTVLGTPYYISPEMCEGKPYNDKSDIWALGCILYEMACLQKTFEGSNLPALVNKIMKGQFAPVKGNYSQEFKDLVMTMLNQDPSKRPSAHELMYSHLPKLMSQYEESSDVEEDLTTSADGASSKKKTSRKADNRSILYYFEGPTAKLTPIELMPKIKIRTTAVGPDHVIVVTTESQVYTWGDGGKGQLGHGDKESREKPELVNALAGKSIIRACCGEGFSVFVSDRGIVLTCGDGSDGCLGHGDWLSAYRPRLIESLLHVDVTAMACGRNHVVVVGHEGEIFAWGNGADGKLGLGNEENHCEPMKVAVSEPVMIADVFCGVDGTMFLTDVGSVFACGCNKDNKLGLNNRHGFIMAMRNIFTRTEVEGQKVPTSVRNLSRHKVLDISMGLNHTAVIVEPGHVYTFGRNTEGQLGIGNTKPQNSIMEVKSMPEGSTVTRVQSGEHYTVAGTHKNELLYWGLRFKEPGPYVEDSESKSSTNGSLVNKDDLRVESVTPRNASHSRQTSISSVNSITSIPEKETDAKPAPASQTSVDSSISGLTDSGFTEINTASEFITRTGFRPLSSVPRRSASASSREAKEKDADASKDDSEIIFPPNHLMKILPAEESLSLTSFFCHGENIFVQLETTAPAPRRRSRKKRGIRKRYSGSTLPVPDNVTSASSREGGDEYSSEASEMDTQVPTWIRQELALCDMDVNDGNEADDTSDQSDLDLKRGTIDSSMSSIQINRDLTPCKIIPDKKPSPRGVKQEKMSTLKQPSPREVRPRSFSNSTTESEIDNVPSDSTSKGFKIHEVKSDMEARQKTSTHRQSSQYSYRAKSATSYSRGPNRLRQEPRPPPGHDVLLKEQLAARGFVSDVTVKRREEALIGELKVTREEKQMIERRLQELEEQHLQQQEQLRNEAEQRALEREKSLQEQIQLLQQQLQTQNTQLKDHQKTVHSLQEQLTKVQKKKKKLRSEGTGRSSERNSTVCVVQ